MRIRRPFGNKFIRLSAFLIGVSLSNVFADIAPPPWWHVIKRNITVENADSLPFIAGNPNYGEKCVLVSAIWYYISYKNSRSVVHADSIVPAPIIGGSASAEGRMNIYITRQKHLDSVGLANLALGSGQNDPGSGVRMLLQGLDGGFYADSTDKRTQIDDVYRIRLVDTAAPDLGGYSALLTSRITRYSGHSDSVPFVQLSPATPGNNDSVSLFVVLHKINWDGHGCFPGYTYSSSFAIHADTINLKQSEMATLGGCGGLLPPPGEYLYGPKYELGKLKAGGYHLVMNDSLNLGDFYVTGTQQVEATQAKGNTGMLCHPNPFNPVTAISFPNPGKRAQVAISDIHGKIVRQWNNLSGNSVVWDAKGMASGVYLFKVAIGGKVMTKTIVLRR